MVCGGECQFLEVCLGDLDLLDSFLWDVVGDAQIFCWWFVGASLGSSGCLLFLISRSI